MRTGDVHRSPPPGASHEGSPDPESWCERLLEVLAPFSLREQELLLRAVLLIERLREAPKWLLDNDMPYRDDFARFIDDVWRWAHHGDHARVTAMAICRAFEQSRDGADVIPRLRRNGYVQLSAKLVAEDVTRAHAAWLDRSKGRKPGRVGKFSHVANMVRAAGLTISPDTIERLWRIERARARPPATTLPRIDFVMHEGTPTPTVVSESRQPPQKK